MKQLPVTITLDEPIEGHEGEIREITVSPAKYRTIMALGEPYVICRTKDGATYALEDPVIIAEYVERMVDEKFVPLLPQLCMSDTLQLKKAVLDFFASARKANSVASPKSPDGQTS